jgi:dienelactone hydrolase
LTSGSELAKANEPIMIRPPRDYSKENPVSDEIFKIYEGLYSYEKAELEPEIAITNENSKYWIKQKVFYNGASRGERMFAYLFLPKGGSPPYQALIIFPGSGAFDLRSSGEGDTLWSWYTSDLIIRSGRAVLYPIYKSMFERGDGYSLYDPKLTARDHAAHILNWRQEIGRSIDYLETRPDIDCRKLCYYGSSWGSVLATIYLALENRFQTGILRLGGLPTFNMWAPEVDPVNFASRIKIPILMLNGQYDYIFPFETSQKPLLRFLGTPDKDKRLEVFPVDHSLSGHNAEVARLVLDWLDHYLGPVK